MRGFSCWDQVSSVVRPAERKPARHPSCLRVQPKLYHMGFRDRFRAPADANESHDWGVLAILNRAALVRPRRAWISIKVGWSRPPSTCACRWGQVSPAQGGREDAHAARPPWQYPNAALLSGGQHPRRRPSPAPSTSWRAYVEAPLRVHPLLVVLWCGRRRTFCGRYSGRQVGRALGSDRS